MIEIIITHFKIQLVSLNLLVTILLIKIHKNQYFRMIINN